jgi:pimeloyl-ACP methyl ester carboxylesterase
MQPVAVELSKYLGIIEPFQTESSIEGQVDELRTLLQKCGAIPLTLIGHSWGAWLSCLFASRYPDLVQKLILISTPPFEEQYASCVTAARLNRVPIHEQKQLHRLIETIECSVGKERDNAFAILGSFMHRIDSFDPLPFEENNQLERQSHIFQSVLSEARELRKSGELLQIVSLIQCPVTAIHGDFDPHPAEGVEKPLTQLVKDFHFVLLRNCGHTHWRERQAKEEFYKVMKEQIAQG